MEIKISPRIEAAVLAVLKYNRAVEALIVAHDALAAAAKSEGGEAIPSASAAFEAASKADLAARKEAIQACAGRRITPRYEGEMGDLLILEGLHSSITRLRGCSEEWHDATLNLFARDAGEEGEG